MSCNKKECRMEKFMSKNKTALENPLIKNFLDIEENFNLVRNTVNNPTPQKIARVDEVFRDYFNSVKLLSYVSKLIHFFSIDYDKALNKIKSRFLLTLDQPTNQDGEGNLTKKDTLESPEYLPLDSTYSSSLVDQVQSYELHSALLLLTARQLELLSLIYYENLQLKEIAEITNTTPQNISNQHRRALGLLRKHLNY